MKKDIIPRKVATVLIIIGLGIFLFLSTYGWHFKKADYHIQSSKSEKVAKNLKRHVRVLSRQIGWRNADQYENLLKSAKYISDDLEAFGLEVRRQSFFVEGKEFGNIIAEKKGTLKPEDIIIVGANFDTHLSPGADANASGVAVLLELARVFAQVETECTIRFVAFVNKEPPFFGTPDMGSFRYVELLQKKGDRIKAVIILDSVGYFIQETFSQRYPPLLGILSYDKGDFIAVIGNIKSMSLAKSVERIIEENASFETSFVIGFDFINSDHMNFWKAGYPTVLITDTGGYRNPYYRSVSDTYQELNYRNMSQLVKGLGITLYWLTSSFTEQN